MEEQKVASMVTGSATNERYLNADSAIRAMARTCLMPSGLTHV